MRWKIVVSLMKHMLLSSLLSCPGQGRMAGQSKATRLRHAPASGSAKMRAAASRTRTVKRHLSVPLPSSRPTRQRIACPSTLGSRLRGSTYPEAPRLEALVQEVVAQLHPDLNERPDSDGTSSGNEAPAASRRRTAAQRLSQNARLRNACAHILLSSNPAQVRAGLSFLEESALHPETRRRYRSEVEAFVRFCDQSQLPLVTSAEVDVGVVAYLNSLYLTGEPLYKAERMFAGLLHLDSSFSRAGGRHLPRAARALRGFRRQAPGRSRVPHPLVTWLGIAVDLTARRHLAAADATLLMVQAYLRPGELLRLRPSSFIRPTAGAQSWSLLLHQSEHGEVSKTGARDESLLLDSAWATWMQPFWATLAVAAPGRQHLPVWPFDSHGYSTVLNQTLVRLGLSLVPYQARHSGPSHDRAHGLRSQLEVMKRGRWQSLKSVVRYEKGALLSKTFNDYPAATQAWLSARASECEDIMLRGRPLSVLPPFA